MLEVRSALPSPHFRNYTLVNPQVGSPRDLGVRHVVSEQVVKLNLLLRVVMAPKKTRKPPQDSMLEEPVDDQVV